MPCCLSVRLWRWGYRGHRLKCLKMWIIRRLISLTYPLSADTNITDLLPWEHPQILSEIGVRYGKIGPGRTQPAISSKRLKIERKLLLTAYIRLYTGFRLPPKCMTLNDLWARFKVIDSLSAAKMTKYSLVILRRHVEWLSLLALRILLPCTYLLTYTQNNQCPLRLACDAFSWLFIKWFVFRSTAFGRP